MRCAICDRALEKPVYNRLHEDFDPCGVCLEVIHGIFSDFPDDYETGEAAVDYNEDVYLLSDDEILRDLHEFT